MKKFLLLLLVPLSSYGASGLGGTPISAVPPLLNPGSTPLVTYPVYSSYSITNQNYFGYGQIISNGFPSTGPTGGNVDGIALIPYGGNYYGITITNSYLISSTNEQACLGLAAGGNISAPISTNFPMNFYDLRCISSGSNGDAVSWKESSNSPTNRINFYNSEFTAANYAFNQVGSRSTFTFHNCNFRAIGPSGFGASVCFMPDQGWLTNYLYSCNFVAANGGDAATWCYLSQIKSVNYFYGCSFEASDTNNVGSVACMELSGEGQYITEFNSCTFYAKGGATAKIMDLSSGGNVPNTLYINNCTWKGSPTTVVDNTGGNTTIIVNGGNFTPDNFVTSVGVIFIDKYGSNVVTANNTFLIQTNFISGTIYSNSYGVPIQVGANIITTAAAVTGVAKMDLRISGIAGKGTTNTIAEQTGAAVIVGSNTNWLSGLVPPTSTYTFTNTSSGAGNSAATGGGQLFVY